ncbi:MAG TPA: efflux RND transporter periplasmic adaptor subunit [Gemmatimonadaceae bacterium]|nr:efflux RND transporter periplasmic adaptor subunit [Gemmatimonadaceae bacterium]
MSLAQGAALAGVLAATTLGGGLAYARFAPTAAETPRPTAVEVTRGPITASVTATGSVNAPSQVKVGYAGSTGAGGRITEVLARVGDRVVAGQPLVRTEDATARAALAEAHAAQRSALAKLEAVRAGARPEDIRAYLAQVEGARIKLEQARAASDGPEAAAARSQVDAAQAKLDHLVAGPRPDEIAAARAQIAAAESKLQALLSPRPEDLAAAQSQVESARLKLEQLRNPRPEDVRSAEASLDAARQKLQALLEPRPEEVATAQSTLDTARTKLAQLTDQPKTATPQDVGNAELAVQAAQVALDKARADAWNAGKPGSSLSETAAEAAAQTALINLQQAQNNLARLKAQGPTDWDVRQAQLAVESAEASLRKLRTPPPADVAAARAAVEAAAAQLQKLTHPQPGEVRAAEEAVRAAEAALEKLRSPSASDVAAAEAALAERHSALEKLLTPSTADLEGARHAVVQAQASLDKLLAAGGYDARTALVSLEQAQAALDAKRAGPTGADLAAAEAAVAQAAAAVHKAEAALAAAIIGAPFDGVVATVAATAGDKAEAAAVTVVDDRELRLDVSVDETDVAKLRPGQTATVHLDALPNVELIGTVAAVAPVGTSQNGVVTYGAQIQLDATKARDAGVRPTMTASATIVTASKQDAVVLPSSAIRTVGPLRTVEVLGADGKAQTRQVQTGIVGELLTEITGGLNAGERVIPPAPAGGAGLRGPGDGDVMAVEIPAGSGPGGPGPHAGAVMIQRVGP